ncbi:MAG: hypothetical protein D6788_08875 [Planctomycetota bacterium]|nr:MAG: hypothetical protein D6788_08875 [Planctomycetota bacterium]
MDDVGATLPFAAVATEVPGFLGPVYRTDSTSLDDVVILVTLPVAAEQDAWFRIVDVCAEGEQAEMEACADRYPELLDNRDWVYFSAWSAPGGVPRRLLAVARYGRLLGQTAIDRIFVSRQADAADDLGRWRTALLDRIAGATDRELDELQREVIEFALLGDDLDPFRAWNRARTYSIGGPCNQTRDFPHCTSCCDDIFDGCSGMCDALALKASAVGCAGAAIGCGVTELLAPAALQCCTVVGGLLGGFFSHGCKVNCRREHRTCKDDCHDRFD